MWYVIVLAIILALLIHLHQSPPLVPSINLLIISKQDLLQKCNYCNLHNCACSATIYACNNAQMELTNETDA